MRVAVQDMQAGDQGMKVVDQRTKVAAPDAKNDTQVYFLENTKAADLAGELGALTDVEVAVVMTALETVEAVDIVPELAQLV